MYNHKTISVIFPAYNEKQNITRAVASFKKLGFIDEILVIDNNSTDGTAKLARQAGARVVKELNQGYGYALKRGMVEALGDYVVLCEPDGTFFAHDVIRLLQVSTQYDAVFGTRTNLHFIRKRANMGWFLRGGNICLAKIMQVLYDSPCSLSDCGCTYRVMSKKVVRATIPHLRVGGSYFLSELTVLILREGFSVIEIPVHYGERIGVSKITGSLKRAIIVGLQMLRVIVLYKFH
jgi:glycosyltransferase involved in cell wall biosynthesis